MPGCARPQHPRPTAIETSEDEESSGSRDPDAIFTDMKIAVAHRKPAVTVGSGTQISVMTALEKAA